MIIGEVKPSLAELVHFGVKGMKWGVRSDSRLRPSNLMTVKEGTPKAERIRRVSEAQQKVSEAKTVSDHKKALDNLAAVQRANRAETGKAALSTHPDFSKRMQSIDQQQHGKRAVARINERMHEGMTRKEALHREDVRNARQRLAVVGGLALVSLLADHGNTPVGDLKNFIGNKANANRSAAKTAASTIKIGAQATTTPFAKKHRGVHNITTMK